MELSLESAFSTGGLVGHLSYLLLVVSMLMRSISLLRLLVILSAFTAIAYDWFWLRDPVGVFWESLLVLVNLVQLSITAYKNRAANFSLEEQEFMEGHLPGLSRGQRRRLLNHGLWITSAGETEAAREDEPVRQLIYLASGRGFVTSGKHSVAVCEPGAFIGEMTVLRGEPANATVTLVDGSRYWAIDAEKLRSLVKRHSDIGDALRAGFTANLRRKLVRSNRFITDSGGVRDPKPSMD